MLKAEFAPYTLVFKETARTSREVMNTKQTYFVRVFNEQNPTVAGYGECALFRGLSCDDVANYEEILASACRDVNMLSQESLRDYPSILFGFETAMNDLRNGGNLTPFPSTWSAGEWGITINGLVWMGSIEQMSQRIEQKIRQGFRCLKFKVGGEDFYREFELLHGVRQRFNDKQLEIRLDANGAFSPDDALGKLQKLSTLHIHSIEQPVKAGNVDLMAKLCAESPIPIALDEELIGVNSPEKKYKLLDSIHPQYIILKPALCGGFSGAMEWKSIAELLNIGWWATSALESNVGLNAIAQWVSTLKAKMPQGLGTGALYTNNIPSPLVQTGDSLFYDPAQKWDKSVLNNLKWQ
ncbi:MAG: o-succinylbenzoate synthase [Firmicutes bacterium]|nr:o-succinylbenzoate synthase [Bacillota bacterium]MCM1401422.1 o-succinylbenzoate synthase [Bacteroides sp.]MCM1477308.1 o-succinylbenzoate synthase [Bacteroides sp.]